jgi:hypothetical protein
MFDTRVRETESGVGPDAVELSLDAMEQELLAGEALIARVRGGQLQLIEQLDAAQVALADGCRSMGEWVAGRLDVAPETAAVLVRLSRVEGAADELAGGGVSFDRAAATATLRATDAPNHVIESSRGLDITGVRALAARWRPHTRHDEIEAFESRQIAIQPTLDNAMWRGWFQLSGLDGKILEDALNQRADHLPDDRDASRRQRMADALVAIAQDALDSHGENDDADRAGRTPLVSLFANADIMAATANQAGIEVAAGPRAGITALEELLCTGSIEWIQRHPDGRFLGVGRKTRVIPGPLRRAVMARDGGCVADGCRRRYRLQVHHILSWLNGGETEPENLVTVCWYHHHVVIHGRGQDIDPNSPPGRTRFLRSTERGPPKAA